MTFIFMLSVAVMVINLPIYFFLLRIFLGYIKSEHSEKWSELGQPSVVANNTLANNVSTLSFLYRKKYTQYDDEKLNEIADRCRISLIIGVVSFAVALVSVFIV